MKITATTTFSLNGYNEYAHKLIETFVEFWPSSVHLYAYYDDMPVTGWKTIADNVHYIKHDSEELLAFKTRNKNNPKQSSELFLTDGIRFSHKVFAYVDAAMHDSDIAIWLDGDVITHTKVTEDDIISWLGGKMAGALLRPWQYTETGFVITDMRHPDAKKFMTMFLEQYTKDKLWDLPLYTDCHAYDATMAQFPAENWHNLSPDIRHSHPFVNGILGEFMDHCKGPRKQTGKSHKSDIVVDRKSEYWK